MLWTSDFRLCKAWTVDNINSPSFTQTKIKSSVLGPVQFSEYLIFCSFCEKKIWYGSTGDSDNGSHTEIRKNIKPSL